jgi:hypothetical protein
MIGRRIFGIETEFGCFVRDERVGTAETVVEAVKNYAFHKAKLGLIDLTARDEAFEPARSGGFLINGDASTSTRWAAIWNMPRPNAPASSIWCATRKQGNASWSTSYADWAGKSASASTITMWTISPGTPSAATRTT